jgi:hypothetical protein
LTVHQILSKSARLAVVVAAVSTAATTPAFAVGSATPASPMSIQTAGCDSSGYANNNVFERCTSLSSGALFTIKSSDGIIKTWYVKVSGSQIYARLGTGYVGIYWSGWIYQDAGTTSTHTNHIANINMCYPTTGLLDVTGQQVFETPSTVGC